MTRKKQMNKIFSITNTQAYLIIKVLGFTMHLYNNSQVTKNRQLINKIIKLIKKPKVFYRQSKNNFVRVYPESFEQNFKDYLSKDISQKYLNLIKGLDEQSVGLISLTISRFQKAAKTVWTDFEPSDDERAQMNLIEENLDNKIIKVAQNIFAYKNYFLDRNQFEAKCFFNQNGLCDIDLAGGGGAFLKGRSILDAGAYIGDSAIVFAKYTDKKIYCFEPSKLNLEIMQKTIKLNNLENKIVPINSCLGDKNEKMCLQKDGADGVIVEINEDTKDEEIVEQITIDEFVKENNVEVGLIKTDIEGFEPNLLRGAFETIKTQKPILIISIYHNAKDFFEIKPLIESWNLGYKFKVRKYNPYDAVAEMTLIAESRTLAEQG
jgi:FkbM family methyltransferase